MITVSSGSRCAKSVPNRRGTMADTPLQPREAQKVENSDSKNVSLTGELTPPNQALLYGFDTRPGKRPLNTSKMT